MSRWGRAGGGNPPHGNRLNLKQPALQGVTKTEHFKSFTDVQLKNAGFSKGITGWYYPTASAPTHVHLITSGALDIRVTAVSWKRDNQPQGNLHKSANGTFVAKAGMPNHLREPLEDLALI